MLCGAHGVAGICCLRRGLPHPSDAPCLRLYSTGQCHAPAAEVNGPVQVLNGVCRLLKHVAVQLKGIYKLAVQSDHTTPSCQSSSDELDQGSSASSEGLDTCRRVQRRTT